MEGEQQPRWPMRLQSLHIEHAYSIIHITSNCVNCRSMGGEQPRLVQSLDMRVPSVAKGGTRMSSTEAQGVLFEEIVVPMRLPGWGTLVHITDDGPTTSMGSGAIGTVSLILILSDIHLLSYSAPVPLTTVLKVHHKTFRSRRMVCLSTYSISYLTIVSKPMLLRPFT